MSNLIIQNNSLSTNTTFVQQLQNALQQPQKSKPYTAYITRNTPSTFVFLIDQSGSMEGKMTLANGESISKSEFCANAINNILNHILDRCIKGSEMREYFEVAVIGYGGISSEKANFAWEGNLAGKTWVTMSELAANPLSEIEVNVERTIRGKVIHSTEKRKSWITPKAQKLTPMLDAYRKAGELIEEWLVKHNANDVYPPTIINLTDGEFTDAKENELLQITSHLKKLHTIDGNILVFNAHISDKSDDEVIFPSQKSQLPKDKYASILFDMSSDLPDVYGLDIAKMKGEDLKTYTGMAYNCSLEKLVHLMNIGTSTTNRNIKQQ